MKENSRDIEELERCEKDREIHLLRETVKKLEQENKELKEYKRIAELTKISCCTAQNCEALNNAIREGTENQKLKQENKKLKKDNDEYRKIMTITRDLEIAMGDDFDELERIILNELDLSDKTAKWLYDILHKDMNLFFKHIMQRLKAVCKERS